MREKTRALAPAFFRAAGGYGCASYFQTGPKGEKYPKIHAGYRKHRLIMKKKESETDLWKTYTGNLLNLHRKACIIK